MARRDHAVLRDDGWTPAAALRDRVRERRDEQCDPDEQSASHHFLQCWAVQGDAGEWGKNTGFRTLCRLQA